MADILLDTQTQPSTPSASTAAIFIDSTAKILCCRDDAGKVSAFSTNAATAAQTPAASDVYIINSNILIPSFSMQAKSIFRWQISASKTGAGTAAPVYTFRIGTGLSTSDTSRLALTGPAQTAIADIATLNLLITCRSVGASGVIQGTAWWDHRGTAASSTIGVGFANDGTGHVEGTSAGFDNSALGGSSIGLSINSGASAAWTITQVIAEASW
mgnify:CR=1 FL=1